MRKNNLLSIFLACMVLFLAMIACDTSDEEDQGVRTLVATEEEQQMKDKMVKEQEDIEPTDIPATDTPAPTETPETEGLVPEGTNLVGEDIEPGIYVGLAGNLLSDQGICYWERLSGLSGELDDVITNDIESGLFYVEVLETDLALKTDCELLPLDKVPAPETPKTEISEGMYMVGRDIEAGTWRGETDDTCYWERLSCAKGTLDCIITNDIPEGQFFIEVSPSDYAISVTCNIQKIEE